MNIIELAKEAGMAMGFTQGIAVMNHKNLERFAALVRAKTKADVIKLCESWDFNVNGLIRQIKDMK